MELWVRGATTLVEALLWLILSRFTLNCVWLFDVKWCQQGDYFILFCSTDCRCDYYWVSMGSLCLVLISIGVFQTVLVKGINWLDVIAKASESSSFIYCTIKGLYITIVTYIYTMFPNLSILMLLFFAYAYFGCWNAAGLRAGLLHGVIRSFHAWNYLTGGQALAWGCRSRVLRWKTQAWFKVLIYIIYLIYFFYKSKEYFTPHNSPPSTFYDMPSEQSWNSLWAWTLQVVAEWLRAARLSFEWPGPCSFLRVEMCSIQ